MYLTARAKTSITHLQGWGLYYFPGHPVPMLDHPFCEKILPDIQSKLPLWQLEVISSHSVTFHQKEDTDSHLTIIFFQVIVENDEVSPQPSLLQDKQPQFTQLFLITLVF